MRNNWINVVLDSISVNRTAAESPEETYGHVAPEKLKEILTSCTELEEWLVDLQLKQEQLSKHERPVLICADMKKKNQELKAQAEMSEGRKHKRASKGGGRLNLPDLREITLGCLE